jgi:hypothetical protein
LPRNLKQLIVTDRKPRGYGANVPLSSVQIEIHFVKEYPKTMPVQSTVPKIGAGLCSVRSAPKYNFQAANDSGRSRTAVLGD